MITDPFARCIYFFDGFKPLTVTYEGEPIPKGRPRIKATGRPFTPKRTTDFEKDLGWTIREQFPGVLPDSEHEWGLAAVFYLPTRRKSDIDNLEKAVLDGANGIFFADDKQVTAVAKLRSYDKNRPRIEMAFFKLSKVDE